MKFLQNLVLWFVLIFLFLLLASDFIIVQ